MKKITIIILLLCGTIFAQPSASTQDAKTSLTNILAYRQDFINRQHNEKWMEEEYGRYQMKKYEWGFRQKTVERDQIEIDIRVLKFYEKYSGWLVSDLRDGLISGNQRIKLNDEIMSIRLWNILNDNKERVFPPSKEACNQ